MNIDRRRLLGISALGAGAYLMTSGRTQTAQSLLAPVSDPNVLPKLPIGMNLAAISDWDPGFPFRNLMWGAREWMTRNQTPYGPWNTGMISHFQFDENGYPLAAPVQVPGTEQPQAPFTLLPNVRKPGKYVLLHDGEGAFEGIMGTRVISARPGRVLLEMTNKVNLVEGIMIKRSVPGNHVRNMRVVALEDEKADLVRNPFLPEFLDFCRPFHCLRFMDWGATNNSIEEEWANRKRLGFYTMIGKTGDPDGLFGPKLTPLQRMYSGGVAIELMIQLANELGIDPWFCIPHRATDEYIREHARLVKATLDPRLKVHVEFSNEIWNWGFIQAGWMLSSKVAGSLLELKGGKAWDPASGKGINHPERTAALFRRAFGIWEQEWTGADRKRLVRICSVQGGWLDTAIRTTKWCVQNGGADALAPTGYFAPSDAIYKKWEEKGASLTADEVIADMRQVILQERQGGYTPRLATLARSLGLRYVNYEGGQHIQPKGQAITPYMPALAAAQSHPAMYDLYIENLRLQQELGNSLFCAFSSVSTQGTRWGSWGQKASYDQPLSEAPKMRALLDCNTVRT